MLKLLWTVILSLFIASCTNSEYGSPPYTVFLVESLPGHCNYEVQPVELSTMTDLGQLEGEIGTVLTTNVTFDYEGDTFPLDSLDYVPVDFAQTDRGFFPMTAASMWGASFYRGIERASQFFKGLGTNYDPATHIDKLDETIMYHDMRAIQEGHGLVTTNAAYAALSRRSGGVFNMFLGFPFGIESVPFAVNHGVMVHEFTHMLTTNIYRYDLLQQEGISQETQNTLSALDEGLADYFGFVASGDPRFLLCSLPNANRDLTVTKVMSSTQASRIQTATDYDPHPVGAIWAAVQYKIGEDLGSHTENAKRVFDLMRNFSACRSGNTVTLSSIKNCDLNSLPSGRSAAEAYYNEAFGAGL